MVENLNEIVPFLWLYAQIVAVVILQIVYALAKIRKAETLYM
jgi:hypothetical protein